jgi:hypothetical protein
MNKNNSKCDIHMYSKIKYKISVFVTTIFEGISVLSPVIAMIANIPRLIAKTPFCNIEHPYGRSNKGQ